MGNTTPAAIDPLPRRIENVRTFKAASTIYAGQIVAFADSGVSDTVAPATSSLGSPAGVALYSASTGAYVAVAGSGSELKVMLSTDNGTADAGDWLGVSTIAGCAVVQDGAIAAHNSEATGLFPVGQALEDIAAGASNVGGKGYIRINLSPIWTASS
jgi:hypothetical protein